jgi:hypothetical protein
VNGRGRALTGALYAMGAALVYLVTLQVRERAGLWGALGTDAPLWGLTALDLEGRTPLVPPGYPALIRVLYEAGLPLVTAGWNVSAVAGAFIPCAVFWAALTGGATRSAAVIAAALALVCPDVAVWSQQVQPDSLAALGLVLAGGLSCRAMQGSARAALLLALVAGLLPLVRSHGLALVPLAVVVLFQAPVARGRSLALLVVCWWAGPWILGGARGWSPFDVTWSDRTSSAVSGLLETDAKSIPYIRELHHHQRREYLALVTEGRLLSRLVWHCTRSLELARDGWVWIGAAILASGIGRRRENLALAAPLLCAAPALIIWSQRRHVMVVVPLALAVLAITWRRPVGPARWRNRVPPILSLVLACLLASSWPAAWKNSLHGLRTETVRARTYARVGDWLAENAPRGSLLGSLHQDLGLYHPLPRHDPDGSAADWRTFLVTDRSPPVGWSELATPAGGLTIYRLEPDIDPRPCSQATLQRHLPHLLVGAAKVELYDCEPADPRLP